MKSYLIGYDLNKTGQDYNALTDKIKTLGSWWHCLDSTWIVKSNLNALEIHNLLWPLMDSNDELLVVLLTREAAWDGFNTDCSDWLTANL